MSCCTPSLDYGPIRGGGKKGGGGGWGGWRTRSKACVANFTSSPAKLDERESDDKTTKGGKKITTENFENNSAPPPPPLPQSRHSLLVFPPIAVQKS